jgi:3-phosphoshikimate 1-carboxyvinyltransferase
LATDKFKLTPFDVDGSKFPDLVPTLAFVASHIEGKSTLRHLSVLRHKESDRIEEILKILRAFSIDFSFDDSIDELVINGKLHCSPPVSITTARDHRMVMMAYLFLRANNGGHLGETDCVEKSFPDFFYIM